MLSDERREFIGRIIQELRNSANSPNPHYAFEAVCKAERLFGEEVPQIKPCFQETCNMSGTVYRNARVIVALLEDYLIRSKDDASAYSSVLKVLSPYKTTYRHYSNGLAKYQDGIYERNTLDDMRAALESLVREITGKEKTLENQVSIICTMLDEHGVKPEIRNLFQKTLDYFTKYQNNYVKHNDEVDPAEVSFVIEWTGVLMKYVINMLS